MNKKNIQRAVSCFIMIIWVFSFMACTKKENKMYIKPSEFSKETRNVLELFDDEVQFFDIVLDENIKSETINIWAYRDGAWEKIGKTYGPVEQLERRIAVRLTEKSYELYSIDKTGHVKYSSPELDNNFEKCISTISSRIEGETQIIMNEEIPIWMKIGSGSSSIENYNITDDFRTIDCDAGVVVTLTVSDKIVE